MKNLSLITGLLLVVGGLNWLLVGLFKWDLVAELVGKQFGQVNIVSRIIYILVGLAAIAHIPALRAALRHDDERPVANGAASTRGVR